MNLGCMAHLVTINGTSDGPVMLQLNQLHFIESGKEDLTTHRCGTGHFRKRRRTNEQFEDAHANLRPVGTGNDLSLQMVYQ